MKEHFITPTDNGNGYKIVGLRSNNKRCNKYVHRLVADHFLEKPLGKNFVNHIDYDKSNNSVSNLEWCTQQENTAYSVPHMRKPKSICRTSNTGEKYISRKIDHRKNIIYRVTIKSIGIEKVFANFNEAVRYRNEVIEKWQNQ
jgi:hypothetical protein